MAKPATITKIAAAAIAPPSDAILLARVSHSAVFAVMTPGHLSRAQKLLSEVQKAGLFVEAALRDDKQKIDITVAPARRLQLSMRRRLYQYKRPIARLLLDPPQVRSHALPLPMRMPLGLVATFVAANSPRACWFSDRDAKTIARDLRRIELREAAQRRSRRRGRVWKKKNA